MTSRSDAAARELGTCVLPPPVGVRSRCLHEDAKSVTLVPGDRPARVYRGAAGRSLEPAGDAGLRMPLTNQMTSPIIAAMHRESKNREDQ